MAEQKRPYKKRSDYWSKFNKSEATLENFYKSSISDVVFEPELIGESFYESVASETDSSRSSSRTNKIATTPVSKRFKNIADGMLPFKYGNDGVSIKETIELTQKAYFGVPAFGATIDLFSEFANSDIYLEGGSAASKKFVQAWFKRINIKNLKSQFFREYFRSGNIFMNRLEGKVKPEQSKKIIEAYGASSTRAPIPIKYLMLNPSDIICLGTLSFDNMQYAKVLTSYELSRLSKPTNDHEKQMLEALPEETKKIIKNKGLKVGTSIHIPLNPETLHVYFSKKQDYEPFAVPMGYSVLDDINKKLELKKIDQAIARSIENVVLLVTMGAEPDKGGVNQKLLQAMQGIFKNKSVGRVLVADYTTKAEFIIPDLKKVMGPEKYEILNKDIEEGLQNILFGESKYSDTSIKFKIFMQRLEESRERFLDDFLQPEIKRICLSLGMKNIPQAKFVKTDLLDSADLQKLVVRMMELGILTPEQGLKTINIGKFPSEVELAPAQEKFKEERENGWWTPLVNSIQIQQYEDQQKQQEFDNKLAKQQLDNQVKIAKQAAEQKAKQQKTSSTSGPSGGRPMGTSKATFSAKAISTAVKEMAEFELRACRDFALKYGVEELEDSKKELVNQVCSTIITSSDYTEWDSKLAKSIEDFTVLATYEPVEDILKIGEEHQLDDLSAAILYHSTKISVDKDDE